MAKQTRVEISDQELMDALSDYVTTAEAAARLGMWVKSVRNLIKSGRLHGIKVGRDWLVKKSSIAQYPKTKSPKGRPTRARPKIERTFRT